MAVACRLPNRLSIHAQSKEITVSPIETCFTPLELDISALENAVRPHKHQHQHQHQWMVASTHTSRGLQLNSSYN
jgi:hypothetical protein